MNAVVDYDVTIRLTNENTDRCLEIRGKEGLDRYGLDGVVLDTGAYDCLLPSCIAEELGLPKPNDSEELYTVGAGIAGVLLEYERPDAIDIEIGHGGRSVTGSIKPRVFVKNGACVTAGSFSDGDLYAWRLRRLYGENITPFLLPPSELSGDGLKLSFNSPDELCPKHKCRLPLSTNQTDHFSYVLLGRSWLGFFQASFGPSFVNLRTLIQSSPDPLDE